MATILHLQCMYCMYVHIYIQIHTGSHKPLTYVRIQKKQREYSTQIRNGNLPMHSGPLGIVMPSLTAASVGGVG